MNNQKQNVDLLSKTRNESLERTKSDLLNQYFNGNKKKIHHCLNNKHNIKASQFNYIQKMNMKNTTSSHMPILNNMSNFNMIKKIITMGGSNNIRSNSTKVKGNYHRIIDYKSS